MGSVSAPLPLVLSARRALGRANGLAPVGVPGDGVDLRHRGLRRALAGESFSVRSVSMGALDVVEAAIAHRRPEAVVDFGSGISTVCLLRDLADVHGEGSDLRLISVEQDGAHAESTERMLDRHGHPIGACVVHAPVHGSGSQGGHRLPAKLRDAAAAPPGPAFIDGPSGAKARTRGRALFGAAGPDADRACGMPRAVRRRARRSRT